MKLTRRGKAVVGVGIPGLAALILGWVLLFQPFHGAPSKQTVAFTVSRGEGISGLADRLERAGVIDNATLFKLRAKVSGSGSDVMAATMLLNRGMSYTDVLTALSTGKWGSGKALTVPEGLARGEIAPLVAKSGVGGSYMQASRSSSLLNPATYGAPKGSSLEGFLFPDTYKLPLPATAVSLVERQLAEFKSQFATVDLSTAKQKNLTPYDVLTIAAMIERETSIPAERRLVSAVIWNRLHAHTPLGIDATTRFQFSDWTHPITASQLASPSPWNTRIHQGLPPGPIGNPGLASIKAAASPAPVSYLFYVAKPWTCGEHSFASTQAEFDRAVSAYNAARNSNGGNAPTKCR